MSATRITPQDAPTLASDAELAAHAADTTSVHGIADTSLLSTTAHDHAAVDPGDIADPSLATAEDVAEKVNDLMAAMRTAGLLT